MEIPSTDVLPSTLHTPHSTQSPQPSGAKRSLTLAAKPRPLTPAAKPRPLTLAAKPRLIPPTGF